MLNIERFLGLQRRASVREKNTALVRKFEISKEIFYADLGAISKS